MTTYQKPAVRSAWGETAAPSDLTDPGNTFASKGWQIGEKPPRQYFNWVLNYTFAAVRYFLQTGISTWDVLESYPIGGMTRGSDGRLYQALQASTGVNPVGGTAGFWGPVQGASPANSDHSNSLATTAWVDSNYIAKGSGFSALSGTIANGQVPVGAVTQWQGALAIAGSQVSGPVGQANSILINGGYRSIQWVGQSGQPTWLIGSSDGVHFFVWNPANFSVSDSDQLGGLNPSSGAVGNTIAQRDASGHLFAGYFNQSSANNENPSIGQIMVTNGSDGFLRKAAIGFVGQQLNPTVIGSQVSSALPGGIILKAGSVSGVPVAGVPVDVNIVFTQPFPNTCVGVWPTTTRSVANQGQAVDGSNFASSVSRFGAVITIDNSAATWFAIGY